MSDFDGHHDSNTINITNYHKRIFDIKQINAKIIGKQMTYEIE